MLSSVDALAVLGVDAYVVRVEVDVSSNFQAFSIVGLPDAAVRESGERVRAAIKNSQFTWPLRRITVNLAPADTKKQGPIFDLPIALGVLLGDGQIVNKHLENFAAVGELGLDGAVRPISGVLPMALGALAAGKTALIVPEANAAEAAVIEGLQVFPVKSVADAVDILHNGGREPLPHSTGSDALEATSLDVDWSDVKGQETVKRALEVAAAGGHNILLVGSPGAGKTLLARRLPTILPPMQMSEALEVTKLYSVAGLLGAGQSLLSTRPFRSPHHTVSHAGLVGGGTFPRPGEISLAHHGVLFLDELPEFHRDVLEVLRQPLEDGSVTIARAQQSLSFPARFQLIGSMNPCPCAQQLGYCEGASAVKSSNACKCSSQSIRRYFMGVPGSLLDRIDIHIEVPRLTPQQRLSSPVGESSAEVRERVCRARAHQEKRLHADGVTCNAQLHSKRIKVHCKLDDAAQALLKLAKKQFFLSPSSLDSVLRISRSIADLSDSIAIEIQHVTEALSYRALDRYFVR